MKATRFVTARIVMVSALAVLASVGLMMGQGKGKGKGKGGFTLPPPIKLTVAGMTDGGRFPMANAGQAPSPALTWSGAPAETQSFTILLHDPDPVLAKRASMDVTHWLIYDIPGDATSLPAGVQAGAELPTGARQFSNSMGMPAYFGPAPPPGSGVHHYTWEIWALDTKLGALSGMDRSVVINAMDGHVLRKGLVIGLYGE